MAKKTAELRVRMAEDDMLRVKECAAADSVSISSWVTIAVMRAVREAEASAYATRNRRAP